MSIHEEMIRARLEQKKKNERKQVGLYLKKGMIKDFERIARTLGKQNGVRCSRNWLIEISLEYLLERLLERMAQNNIELLDTPEAVGTAIDAETHTEAETTTKAAIIAADGAAIDATDGPMADAAENRTRK